MELTVEFLGLARQLAQTKECRVTWDGPMSFRQILAYIAEQFPALVGPVIIPETFNLVSYYMLNLNGQRRIADLDAPAADGQRLLLMFTEAGG
ncbi:MAG: MoaD/ThiS family protein [Chloroflexi bacterium]|nr:MoaD/ThiS family protein [Chloroflexota bacterium]